MRTLLTATCCLFVLAACTPAPEDQDAPDDRVDDVSEDTDADVQDSEPEPERPELPEGEDDRFAQTACGLVPAAGSQVIAGASMDEAAQALILPSDVGEVHLIQLPEAGAGFVTIEIPDWMSTVRFFADDLAEYTVHQGQELTSLSTNGACPDERITDAQWAFHEWGSYVIEFSEESPREVWFVALKES